MSPALLVLVYCAVIVAGSLAGGHLPAFVRLTHTRMQLAVSFVAGLMLGASLFHMLPHAAGHMDSLDGTVAWMVGGLLTMFFLIRLLDFHHHEPVEGAAARDHDHVGARAGTTTGVVAHTAGGSHEHDHDHESAHAAEGTPASRADARAAPAPPHLHAPAARHPLSWIGMAIGLGLHTAIDGIALSASVAAEADDGLGDEAGFLGLGTFLAVLLHKPLDALAITSLMAAGGWALRMRTWVNVGFALMCPAGALAFHFGAGASGHDAVVGAALAFAAGVFLCISLGDLLPELQFHSHDRLKLSVALLLGVALAYGIGFLETGHAGHLHHAH